MGENQQQQQQRQACEHTSRIFLHFFCPVCVCVHVWLSLMLMYALGMTLIDLAALLAKYSFFPNLSLSWLLWLLISQLQKPPWMQRDFCALRLLSLSLSLYSLSVVLSLSCASSSRRVSVSFLALSPSFDGKVSLVDGNLFSAYQEN